VPHSKKSQLKRRLQNESAACFLDLLANPSPSSKPTCAQLEKLAAAMDFWHDEDTGIAGSRETAAFRAGGGFVKLLSMLEMLLNAADSGSSSGDQAAAADERLSSLSYRLLPYMDI